jgi:AraC family ethanolamine operon transcriptional activator
MPTLTFANYDAYSDAIQDARVRTTCLGKQHSNWVLSYLSMSNLSVQWCKVGGPGAVEGTVKPGGTVIVLPAENTHAISANGRRFDDFSLMVLKPGEEFCFSASKFTRWISLFIPNEILTDSDESVRANVGSLSKMIRTPLQGAERFRFALENLRLNFERQPTAFDSAAAIKTTARKLAESVRDVLGCRLAGTSQTGRNAIPRKQVIRKAMDFIDQHTGEYLVVGDLATAVGISERTLRTAFQDYFNVGPVHYLKLRTLRQVRRALKAADPSRTTVTEIATQFGVWHFGRFAHDYRLLYAELPSETLRHLN